MLFMEFVHLHTHTEYSLLQSTARIPKLIEAAAAQNMKALAITDKDVMYGVIPFYKQCQAANIKPIIGLELWVEGLELSGSYPVLLLAETKEGYRALLQLSTIKQTESAITMQKTIEILKDCVVIFPYADSEAAELLRLEEEEKALRVLTAWKQSYDAQSIYLERQPTEEKTILRQWKDISYRLSLPLVAGNNVHSIQKDEKEARQALRAIGDSQTLANMKIEDNEDVGTFITEANMKTQLDNDYEAIQQSKAIADRCEVTIDFGQMLLPTYPLSYDRNAEQVLRDHCEKGVTLRYGKWNDAIKERLEHELQIIHQMGFDDYFLIVADFVLYARNAGMLVGPGRGSAAGSLVSYVLEITDVDPLKHDLLFERFLNPERVNMPDIDIDFPDYRRDEVIEYVANKYGKNKVAQIVTFGTFGARAAIRDVGRILEAPQALVDRIASFITQGKTLKTAYEENSTFQDLIGREPLAKTILKLAFKIEGLPRHTSIHAAGIVMSGDFLYNHVPLMKKDDGLSLTQFSMEGLEEIGLLKIDLLGLKNLSLLEKITSSIHFKEKRTIDLRNLSLQDSLTYDMLAEGDTTGIFQLESAGMRTALQQIKPTTFEDIAAVNALYRPGPMENIPIYAERKQKQLEPDYPHHSLKDILSPTYGVIVYQEQIMQIASAIAGYSFGESDLLRRAVSKKDRVVLEQERSRFLKGAEQLGHDLAAASQVYDLIVRFAEYGFNRSHAVAYSFIAYQLAYLKAHYPAHFYASLLTVNRGNTEKMGAYLREAKQKNIHIIPPSVNKSEIGFKADGNSIQFGLATIKNVNRNAVQSIVKERKNALFQDFIDFLMRTEKEDIGRKALESLIKAGAFNEFGKDRAVLLASLDRAMEYAGFQNDLGDFVFGGEENFRYVDIEPFSDVERFEAEKEAIGFYVSGHPLDKYEQVLVPFAPKFLYDTFPTDRKKVWTAGIIEDIRTVRTKQGQSMAFVTVTDGTGELEVVIFPNVYRNVRTYLNEQNPVLIGGRPDKKSETKKLLVDDVIDLEELLSSSRDILYLKMENKEDAVKTGGKIKEVLKKYPGSVAVCLYYEEENKVVQLSDKYRFQASERSLNELKNILSEEFVVLKKHRG